jgi:hypothetical protein
MLVVVWGHMIESPSALLVTKPICHQCIAASDTPFSHMRAARDITVCALHHEKTSSSMLRAARGVVACALACNLEPRWF